MAPFEPGPLELGELPLGPRIVQGAHFETFAADYIRARANTAVQLANIAAAVAGGGIPDVDRAIAAPLSDAVRAADDAGDAGETTPVNDMPLP